MKEKTETLKQVIRTKILETVYRGINEFHEGYKLKTNSVNDENGGLLADPHNIMNRWKNFSCHLLNIRGIMLCYVMLYILYYYIMFYNVLRSINLLILFGIRKNCHNRERNILLYLYIKMVIKLTVVIIKGYCS
jgi:hypothetical protein